RCGRGWQTRWDVHGTRPDQQDCGRRGGLTCSTGGDGHGAASHNHPAYRHTLGCDISDGRLGIRRLPVVEEGKLVGILTERDIFRLILSQQSLLLEAVSESMPAATRDQLRGIVG